MLMATTNKADFTVSASFPYESIAIATDSDGIEERLRRQTLS